MGAWNIQGSLIPSAAICGVGDVAQSQKNEPLGSVRGWELVQNFTGHDTYGLVQRKQYSPLQNPLSVGATLALTDANLALSRGQAWLLQVTRGEPKPLCEKVFGRLSVAPPTGFEPVPPP